MLFFMDIGLMIKGGKKSFIMQGQWNSLEAEWLHKSRTAGTIILVLL